MDLGLPPGDFSHLVSSECMCINQTKQNQKISKNQRKHLSKLCRRCFEPLSWAPHVVIGEKRGARAKLDAGDAGGSLATEVRMEQLGSQCLSFFQVLEDAIGCSELLQQLASEALSMNSMISCRAACGSCNTDGLPRMLLSRRGFSLLSNPLIGPRLWSLPHLTSESLMLLR